MKDAEKLFRLTCWVGAVADLFFGVALLVPSLWAGAVGIPAYAPSVAQRVDMGVGAALMFGWTALLLWAARAPLRRRGVLVLTLFPVLAGLFVASSVSVASGTVPLGGLVPVIVLKVVLVSLLVASLVSTRAAASSTAENPPIGVPGAKAGGRRASFVRNAYLVGAVADLVLAVAMVWPALWGLLLGRPDFAPDLQYRLDLGVGAALMLGWTALLWWGRARPIERRGILLLSAVPVLLGLIGTDVAGIATGTAALPALLAFMAIRVVFLGCAVAAYRFAGDIERANGRLGARREVGRVPGRLTTERETATSGGPFPDGRVGERALDGGV